MSDLPSAAEMAAHGSLPDLQRWAHDGFHFDPTDVDLCVAMAANAVTTGAWRNNTLIEDIHAREHCHPDDAKARGIRDEEMMVASVETSCIVTSYLHPDNGHLDRDDWWQDLAEDLGDPDRALAGVSLQAHVPAEVIEENAEAIARNLHQFEGLRLAVGPERMLLGLALVGAQEGHWGTPMWPVQVRTWAKVEGTDFAPAVVDGLADDPSSLHLRDVRAALNAGLGYFPGRPEWHRHQCGDPHHEATSEAGLSEFFGFTASLSGMPMIWQAAAMVTLYGDPAKS